MEEKEIYDRCKKAVSQAKRMKAWQGSREFEVEKSIVEIGELNMCNKQDREIYDQFVSIMDKFDYDEYVACDESHLIFYKYIKE